MTTYIGSDQDDIFPFEEENRQTESSITDQLRD